MEIDISKCEFYNNNYCSCYRDNYGDCYHKCSDKELKDCYYKQIKQLKVKLKKIKEHCNETIRVMGDTGNNPYSQGRTIEAKRVLEILGEDNGN